MPTSPANPSILPLEKRLATYGCTSFIKLDEKLSKPEQLDYLDLLPKQSNQKPVLSAVAENQGVALLYLVDACSDVKSDAGALADLSRRLANRSDPAWLGVARPGSLEIYAIGFHEPANLRPVTTIEERSATAPLFFQSLVHGTFEQNNRLRGTDYVFHKIFDLLTQTTNEFVPQKGKGKLDAVEVLSMAGRALFFRFLTDRGIVLPNERDAICPAATELKDAFSTAEKAAQTSAWLDHTFNGDFLPLINETVPATNRPAREAEYLRFYKRAERLVGKNIFDHLQAILRGWKAVGGGFQPELELDWDEFDFAHIPVGVLSQVYESFSHRADPRTARDTSVHYTPRTIAELMVDQSFDALKDKAAAQVLDPSCGAGIFLVLAFRRLVSERWQHDEERPKTDVIQQILYGQLRGFDVSEPALRLAALALYITAIEVNASQRPPQALKFPRNLRGEVLHRFGGNDNAEEKSTAFSLGSLGPDVSPDFNGRFDIVIGNPPWTRLRDPVEDEENEVESRGQSKTDELNEKFTEIGRRVLTARGFPDLAKGYENPDKNPDLPFLWRAMEWAKKKDRDDEGGIIALAMPARLFGRTTGNGFEAWRAVLRSVAVTGLINGADLRKTAVWDGVDMPFCLFFARNAKPGSQHRFCYASPINEPGLNGGGRFRIDYEVAHSISTDRIEEQPWLLKTLSLGTWLDVEITNGLMKPELKSLIDRWLEWDVTGRQTGEGYNRATRTGTGPGSPQKWVKFLADLPVFQAPDEGYQIDYTALRTYGDTYGTNKKGESSANKPRREELFQPPLVIIPKAPGDNQLGVQAYLADNPLAFSKAYYGYSCAGFEEKDLLAALIFLVMHSTAFRYFSLMCSSSLGVDRMILTKGDIDRFPFPDHRTLGATDKALIHNLAHRLQHDAQKPWRELNEFIFRLYGFDVDAVQVAEDTLFAAAAYRKAGKAALDRTTRGSRGNFVKALREALEPYFDVCGEHVAVREADFQADDWREPWFFLAVSRETDSVPVNAQLMRKAMEAANDRGASRIIVHAPGKRGLLLGLLNQRRWWTVTRARLWSQHIIREHLDAFGLSNDA